MAEMETAEFPGTIHVVDTPAQARSAIRFLKKMRVLGFDTETRPAFRKGCSHKVALVQISTDDTAFLFRINKTGFIEPLRNLLEDPNILKIGLSIKDDFHGLQKIEPFSPDGFVELQDYVHRFGITDASLQKIYAIIFGRRISKGQRLTNWEADELTDAQQRYASLDALACLRLFRHLEAGLFHPEQSPFIVRPEANEASSDDTSNPQPVL